MQEKFVAKIGVIKEGEEHVHKVITLKEGEYLKKVTPGNLQYLRDREEAEDWIAENGGEFIWSIYRKAVSMKANGTQLTQQDFARLLYLATFITHTQNGNKLVYDNGKPIDKQGLRILLGLGERAFRDFYNKLERESIIFDMGDHIAVNEDWFRKGEINATELQKRGLSFARTLVKPIRELYEKYGKSRGAVANLGLLYMALPYINFETNALVANPTETDVMLMERLNLEQVAELFGYNTVNITQALRRVKLNGEYVFGFMQVGNNKTVYVNPRIFWQANRKPDKSLLLAFK
ncbi:hypothetical protein [Geobacillus stearothermophilus]|uniref:hypothetical protein n=1 Tax=Geobacillus stearothermophilus TaxID=1422 RepID=UPI002E229144|nr:hypothetical protein [Geobacillus stearothermophilus]